MVLLIIQKRYLKNIIIVIWNILRLIPGLDRPDQNSYFYITGKGRINEKNIKAEDIMIMLKVSIIMNCYNGEKYLKESLESIIKQTYKP